MKNFEKKNPKIFLSNRCFLSKTKHVFYVALSGIVYPTSEIGDYRIVVVYLLKSLKGMFYGELWRFCVCDQICMKIRF